MASTPAPVTGGTCSTPNCGKPLRARGFCVACYYRLLRRGTLVAGTQTKRWRHRLSDINEAARTATCAACGPVKIRRRGKVGKWRCAPDTDARSKAYKAAYRQSRKAMLKPACEVCGTTDNLCWDHDHATGLFRGTLCDRCNTALGMMDDDPTRFRKAAEYLERTAQANGGARA